MSTIDKFLDLLQDGLWHDLEATTHKVGFSPAKAEMVISFLSEYGFIKLSENNNQIKLQRLTLDFFTQIQLLE
jgi:hypothetical protein